MLTLQEDDRYTYITNASIQQLEIIRQIVRARPKGYRFMPSYRDGVWDGYITLLSGKKFPSGLLPLVRDELKEQGIEYLIEFNENVTQPKNSIVVEGYELRPYQQEAVVTALTNVRGVLHMATNAGKTLVMASIIQAIGNKAVVIVPSRALLLQTADTLEEMLEIEVGRYGANYQDLQDVTVTTLASLPKLIKENLRGNLAVFVDECHHVSSNTIMDNIFQVPGSYRFGLSGTPLKLEELADLKLMAATGPVIYTVKNEELIDQGFSVPPDIRFLTVDEPDAWDEEYEQAYRDCIVGNPHRNEMIAKIVAQADKPVLVLVNWVEHALKLGAAISGMVWSVNVPLAIATGQDSPAEMAAKLEAFRQGDIQVLVATNIFGEGVDIPVIRTLVLAGGGKSHINLLQRVGRGLRTAEGKDGLVVYDFIDDTNKYLLKHSDIRNKLYREEKFEVRIVQAESS